MNLRTPLVTIALSVGILLPGVATAQTAQEFVGTWQLVSNTNVRQDGTKVDIFGSNPKGLYVFTNNGHFAIVNVRPDLPKFASNNRNEGTTEENKAIVQGSIALFGTYSVADKVLTQSRGQHLAELDWYRPETKLYFVRRRAEVVTARICWRHGRSCSKAHQVMATQRFAA